MKIFAASAAALAIGATAQRPSNVTICDYYSNALLGGSNATSEYTLLTLLVNTAIIGNYTANPKVAVPGILAQNATYNGTKVDLLQYFDGSIKSTNNGGKSGAAVNWLDGGGAKPLTQNKPADDKKSNQYQLVTHLYQYFGVLLGCSNQSTPAFPAYQGDSSMYSVHKYMALDAYEVQYFIEQVGLTALSFGVSMADVEYVGHALQSFFGDKCAPETSIIPKSSKELQSICIASDCPSAPNADCKAYGKTSKPAPAANATEPTSPGTPGNNSSGGESGSGGKGNGASGGTSSPATSNDATITGVSFALVSVMVVGICFGLTGW